MLPPGDAPRIELGPFVLSGRIGAGGMAEVWRGTHGAQRVPVAVKVVHGKYAGDPAFVAAFRNEVLSVARLQHPRIITVLDQGSVTSESAERSWGALAPGTPWLAMELATGGTLEDVPVPLDWPTLRACLLGVMDGLAHAHARGVIHRDLKPNNVLLCTPRDVRPGLKLTDFGLACPADRALEVEREEYVAGTPHFMAPEQFRGEWRDYGPWTDLYALGCMAFYLGCGQLPFDGTVAELIEQHLGSEPPTPLTDGALPDGFWAWTRRLMRKSVRERFECVADAAWALVRMTQDRARSSTHVGLEVADALERLLTRAGAGAPEDGVAQAALPTEPRVRDTVVGLGTLPWLEASPDHAESDDVTAGTPPRLATLAWDSVDHSEPTLDMGPPPHGARDDEAEASGPALPETWRSGQAAPDLKLLGAGLGLYGMRTVPLVDRDGARDLVWEALREVHLARAPRVVVLRGPAGMGKSRLAEWLTQRMAEMGAAGVLRAVHGPAPSPGQGLPRMLSQHLGLSGLPRAALVARIQARLTGQGVTDPYEWHALAELVAPTEAGTPDRVAFGSPRERYALVRRHLERTGGVRPVAVWLDDVQWGQDALGLVLDVMEHAARQPCAALFLLTVEEESLVAGSPEQRLVESLAAMAGSRVVSVGPLAPADHLALVGELLGLEDTAAARVAERTAGNPLFATQLVGDWVQRGLLTAGERGFALRAGADAVLPDDIHQVWKARLARLPGGRHTRVQVALELAAVLGMHVDVDEWTDLCARSGAAPPSEVVDALVAGRLLTPVEGGLRFVHGMLHESLERTARESGRLTGHHARAAEMLRTRPDAAGAAERLGRHLLGAGRTDEAVDPLLAGARERLARSEYAPAHAVLDLLEQSFAAVGVPRTDARRGRAWILRARTMAEEGRYDDAHEYAVMCDRVARGSGWRDVTAQAAALLGEVAYHRGDGRAAKEAYARARGAFETEGNAAGTVRAVLGLGDAEYRLGGLDRAGIFYAQALELARQSHDADAAARAHWGLGYVAMLRGEHAAAREHFQEQLALSTRVGSRYGVAAAYNALGEVARASGAWREAAAHYRRSREITREIGGAGAEIRMLNLVLVLLQQGAFDEAHAELAGAWDEVVASQDVAAQIGLWGTWAVCAAHRARWNDFDDSLRRLGELVRKGGVHEADLALELGMAAERALKRGDSTRARRAWAMAREQWDALGDEGKVQECDRAIRALRG